MNSSFLWIKVVYFGLVGLCFLCFAIGIHLLVETYFSKFLFFSLLTSSLVGLTLLGARISGGYFLSGILINKPLQGKKIITPLNGVAFKTVSLFGKLKFTIVLVRLVW